MTSETESLYLPIFPLGMPLFPGVKLELQIFEQRYLKMVRNCLRQSSPFVICALKEGTDSQADITFYDLGVSTEIVDWHQLDNGLLGITVYGIQPIKVASSHRDESDLWWGDIDYLSQEPTNAKPDFVASLIDVYNQLSQHVSLNNRMPEVEDLNASEFGWAIAQILPMPMADRVQYLQSMDPLSRLQSLNKCLDALIDKG